jgi:hypothetical protein
MRLKIKTADDRMTVAAILVKNGYRVHQLEARKDYFLVVDEPESESDGAELEEPDEKQ